MVKSYEGFSVARFSLGWVVYFEGQAVGTITLSRWGKSVAHWAWLHSGMAGHWAPSDFVTRI